MVRDPDHFQPRRPSSEHGEGGQLPLVVSVMICNIKVTNMLVDGGVGLNVLSPDVFKKMQVPPPDHMRPTRPFSGVSPGVTVPLDRCL